MIGIQRLNDIVVQLQASCLLLNLRRSLQLTHAGASLESNDSLACSPMDRQNCTAAMVHHLFRECIMVVVTSQHFEVVDELFVEVDYCCCCATLLSDHDGGCWCILGRHDDGRVGRRSCKEEGMQTTFDDRCRRSWIVRGMEQKWIANKKAISTFGATIRLYATQFYRKRILIPLC